MVKFQAPATTSPILSYQPVFGDYLIWSKWFSTWHGFLVEFDTKGTVTFMMAGLPSLLISQSSAGKSIVKLDLTDIRNSKGGKFAIIRHSPEHNRMLWYV